jgi:ribonuclease BN (tRNA processing enzyme)
MKLTIVGCGDAFGSGGRLNTCYHVASNGRAMLLDCGASAMIGLDRLDLDPNAVDTIVISHLHGDHFAGLVFFLLHAQHVARRTAPLAIIGPPGIEARLHVASEALFAGSMAAPRRHALTFQEITAGAPMRLDAWSVEVWPVSHPSGAPSQAVRLTDGRRILAFSGDTEWTESLIACADGADLFICECYGFDRDVRFHLNWQTLSAHLPELRARRVLLTHMGHPMLAARDRVRDPRVLLAEDGLVLDV